MKEEPTCVIVTTSAKKNLRDIKQWPRKCGLQVVHPYLVGEARIVL